MTGRVVAGIGCRLGCPADDVLAALDRACREAGRPADALAIPWFKRGEPGPAEAARARGLTLLLVDDAALAAAQPRCTTRSSRVARAVGIGSVAEACALAAAGPSAQLLRHRLVAGAATCALAAA